jgi:hypothetical protein
MQSASGADEPMVQRFDLPMMTDIVCEDQCWDCVDVKRVCDAVFERDLSISKTVTCNKCKHEYEYKEGL